mmetsp:Transcript_9984/g.26470  ORF Transcript_9984/g.26470 Transcript_9984/m.26470 type:complete len:296 (-) Transcript_9984:281-1168(-)
MGDEDGVLCPYVLRCQARHRPGHRAQGLRGRRGVASADHGERLPAVSALVRHALVPCVPDPLFPASVPAPAPRAEEGLSEAHGCTRFLRRPRLRHHGAVHPAAARKRPEVRADGARAARRSNSSGLGAGPLRAPAEAVLAEPLPLASHILRPFPLLVERARRDHTLRGQTLLRGLVERGLLWRVLEEMEPTSAPLVPSPPLFPALATRLGQNVCRLRRVLRERPSARICDRRTTASAQAHCSGHPRFRVAVASDRAHGAAAARGEAPHDWEHSLLVRILLFRAASRDLGLLFAGN